VRGILTEVIVFKRSPILSLPTLIGCMLIAGLILSATAIPTHAQDRVAVVSDAGGQRLQVNGVDFMVRGMNWDYIPIGQNYAYSLWNQPDDIIRAALDREMSLLKAMDVNVIRQYAGIPPRWVEYIYRTYGIYTVINHPLGRYGVTINGTYYQNTNYSDPAARAQLLGEMKALVEQYRGVPGMLFWLLGNENNYGLEWKSAETEALPEGERQAARARQLYSFMGEVVAMLHKEDPGRPVAMANGDIQYLEIIAEEVKGLDIFGSNVYRGISARDLFDRVREEMNIPVLFTEFGSDAFNARTMQEDQAMQARYLIGQWEEIYEQSAGKGRAGNAIGGFTFQFSDGWWKYKQTENLAIHDINASWPNGGYTEDYQPGENNMNEEWWGICAKGFPDHNGLYELYPRAAYFALRQAYELDPYAPTTDLATIRAHFAKISPMYAKLQARGEKATMMAETLKRVRVKGFEAKFETISTGGNRISTPTTARTDSVSYPAFRGFDHLESYFTEFEAQPADNVRGSLALSYLGHVPENPIDEIFYENRGRRQNVLGNDSTTVEINDLERLKVYRAEIDWTGRWFDVNGFYRTGHYHWGYEGDFFGLYQEANYGPNIDIYNGEAPSGVEITGKRKLRGLKIALGPELWWGANPALLLKYQREFGSVVATGVYQEDLENAKTATSSIAVPLPKTRKATLSLATTLHGFEVEVGGIWSGSNKIGDSVQVAKWNGTNWIAYQDSILSGDVFGGKAKVMYSRGRWNWYAQGAVMGLVADGGPTAVQTFTGWWLKDSGKGNQVNFLTGFTYRVSDWVIAPNFLYQKPIEGPIPASVLPPGEPRNILDDPFAVRENREETAGEILITYDPTPATWMYDWDSDVREDASLAFDIGYVYRHLPTTQDAAIYIDADGKTPHAFPGATPPRDLHEVHARIVSKPVPGFGLIANLYGGTAEPNGDDPRLVKRVGGDFRVVRNTLKLIAALKVNDFGPYDYHKDFNLTYPLQVIGDLSANLGMPDWFEVPQTRAGIKLTWRSLDHHSPRYCPRMIPDASGNMVCDSDNPDLPHGSEWEIRTYLHLNVGM